VKRQQVYLSIFLPHFRTLLAKVESSEAIPEHGQLARYTFGKTAPVVI
jgi:hypothetical protein